MPTIKLTPTIGEFWITGGSTIEVPAGVATIVSAVDPTTGIRIDADGISMTVEGNEVFNIADNTTPLSVSNFVDYETLLLDDDDIPNKKYVDDIVAGGGPVASVFSRVGVVVAATSDYDAIQVDNTPAGNITATNVQAALNELDGLITAGDTVASVFSRTGVIISANGDYTASQVTNVPAGNITAITVQAALNELDGLIPVVPVDSVFGRTGVVAAAASDYDAVQIDNSPAGNIGSTDVQSAINELDAIKADTAAELTNVPAGNITAIEVQAALNELDTIKADTAAELTNVPAGNITAIEVQAALNELDGLITAGDVIQSVFGRTGAVVGVAGDYTASDITNVPSGTIAATDVQAAVDEINVEKAAWQGEWTDAAYLLNQIVRDGSWLMIANKDTSERPAPQPNGSPVTSLPDVPVWTTPSDTSVVYSGQTYTFTQSGWIRNIRVWAPTVTADTHYRIILIDKTNPSVPIIRILERTQMDADDWSTVAVGNLLVGVGTVLQIVLDTVNSGSDTQFTGGWTSEGTDNNNPPSAESWNRRSADNLLRIDKDDLDSVDRTSELLSVTPDSEIQLLETADVADFRTYTVITDPVDQGSYVDYVVVLVNQTDPLTSGTTTINFTVPIPSATDYVELTTYWSLNPPSFATVVGFLEFDGVDQPGKTDSAFGVDLEFQPASISPDWDAMAVSELVSGGSESSSTAVHLPVYTVATLPGVTLGGMIYVTDEAGGPTPAHSDGISWFRTSDNTIVA